MRHLGLLFCLFAEQVLAQQSSSIIDWLASLQGIQARLEANGVDAHVAGELRELHLEVATWSATAANGAVTMPVFPSGNPTLQELLDYAGKLRRVFEEAERNRPG